MRHVVSTPYKEEFIRLVKSCERLGITWSGGGTRAEFWEYYKSNTIVYITDKNLSYGNAGTCREPINESVDAMIRLLETLYSPSTTNTPSPTPIMSNSILDFFKNMTATADEKLLKELGIEEPVGTPTALGLELAARLNYQAQRGAIIEIARKMKAEKDAAKSE